MVGGTMAWFTSQAEVENVFNAGTVKINAEGEILCEGAELENWNPGDTDHVKYTFVNNGSKDLRFRVGFTGNWLTPGGNPTDLSTDNIQLLGIDGYVIDIEWVWIFPIPWLRNVDDPIEMQGMQAESAQQTWLVTDDWTFESDKYLYYGGKYGSILDPPNDGILESGESVELILEVKLDGPTTGNDYQGKKFKLDALVQAIQASHEDEWDWDTVDFETGLELPQ